MLFKKKLHADVLDAMFETFVPVVDCNIHYFKIINANYLEKKKVLISMFVVIFLVCFNYFLFYPLVWKRHYNQPRHYTSMPKYFLEWNGSCKRFLDQKRYFC